MRFYNAPMPKAPIEEFTWDDFVQLPEDVRRHEVLAGELILSPSCHTRHQEVLLALLDQFGQQVDHPGHGVLVLGPIDVKLSHIDILQPDLLVVLPQHRERITETHIDGPPDLIVEIVSRGSARRDRGRKKDRYELHGVPEYWVVDPRANFVDQHILDGGRYRHAGRFTDAVDLHILPGVRIDLRPVW